MVGLAISTLESADKELPVPISASSSTALLKPPPRGFPSHTASGATHKPILRAASSPVVKGNGQFDIPNGTPLLPSRLPQKGKLPERLVHYSDSPRVRTPGPASPSEVLERTGSDVEETSAGAALSDLDWGDVVMRGLKS